MGHYFERFLSKTHPGEHTCGCSVTLDCPGHDAVEALSNSYPWQHHHYLKSSFKSFPAIRTSSKRHVLLFRCVTSTIPTATGAMVLTAGQVLVAWTTVGSVKSPSSCKQVVTLMPIAQWSDQYVVPVLLTQVVLLLREAAPTTTTTMRAAATSRTDVAAPQTRIALSWRRLCRTISLPSARTMSVSRAAGAMFSQFWRQELNLIWTHIPNQNQFEKSNWLYENHKIHDDYCK